MELQFGLSAALDELFQVFFVDFALERIRGIVADEFDGRKGGDVVLGNEASGFFGGGVVVVWVVIIGTFDFDDFQGLSLQSAAIVLLFEFFELGFGFLTGGAPIGVKEVQDGGFIIGRMIDGFVLGRVFL